MREEPQFPLRPFVSWRFIKLTLRFSKLRIWILYVGFGSYVRFWENQHRWIQILSTLQSHVTASVTYKSWIKGSSMTMYQKEKTQRMLPPSITLCSSGKEWISLELILSSSSCYTSHLATNFQLFRNQLYWFWSCAICIFNLKRTFGIKKIITADRNSNNVSKTPLDMIVNV